MGKKYEFLERWGEMISKQNIYPWIIITGLEIFGLVYWVPPPTVLTACHSGAPRSKNLHSPSLAHK